MRHIQNLVTFPFKGLTQGRPQEPHCSFFAGKDRIYNINDNPVESEVSPVAPQAGARIRFVSPMYMAYSTSLTSNL